MIVGWLWRWEREILSGDCHQWQTSMRLSAAHRYINNPDYSPTWARERLNAIQWQGIIGCRAALHNVPVCILYKMCLCDRLSVHVYLIICLETAWLFCSLSLSLSLSSFQTGANTLPPFLLDSVCSSNWHQNSPVLWNEAAACWVWTLRLC